MGIDELKAATLDRRGFLAASAGAAATAAAASTLGPLSGKSSGQVGGGGACAEHAAEMPKLRRGVQCFTMPAVAWNSEAAFLDHIAFMKSINCVSWEFAGSYPTPAGNNPTGWVALGSYAKTYGFRVAGTHDGPSASNANNLGSAITKMNAWNCNQVGAGSGWPGVPGAGTAITNPATVSAWQAACATMNTWGRAFQSGEGSGVIPTPYGPGMFQGQPVAGGRSCARYYRHFHSEQAKWIQNTGTKYDNNYVSGIAYTECDVRYSFAQSDWCWLLDGLWMAGGGPSVGIQGPGDPNPGQGYNRLVAPDVIERWQDQIPTFHIKDLGPNDQGTQVANIGDNSGPGAATAPFGAVPWDPSQDTVPFQQMFERLRHPELHDYLIERDGMSATVTSNAYYKKILTQGCDMFDKITLNRAVTRAAFSIPTTDAEWAAIQVTGIGGANRPPENGGSPGPECPPTLNGAFEVGHTVKVANSGTWARFDGAPGNFNYVWLRDGVPLVKYNGASTSPAACQANDASSYVLQADDVGHKISCQVTALNNDGTGAGTATTDSIIVAPAPFLGTRELGPGSSTLSNALAEAYRAVAVTSGTLTALDVYIEGGTTAEWLVAGVYADNATANHPGALLGQSDLRMGDHNSAGGWETVTLPSPIAVEAGKGYWIAVMGGGGILKVRNHDGGQGDQPSETHRTRGLSALPATWRTGTVYKNDAPLTAASGGESAGGGPV
jgi:hypothetical protein